jgi:hypothetical protein
MVVFFNISRTDPAYAKEFTCFCKLDFKLPALFLWITLRFANLSNAENALVNNFKASSLLVALRMVLTILRAVLCW